MSDVVSRISLRVEQVEGFELRVKFDKHELTQSVRQGIEVDVRSQNEASPAKA